MTRRLDETNITAPGFADDCRGGTGGSVRVRSVLRYGREQEEIRVEVRGEYVRSADGDSLVYAEHADDGSIVKNVLTLRQGTAVLSRSGAVSSRMVFVEGQTTAFSHATSYGELRLQVHTRSCRMRSTSAGVMVRIDYALFHSSEPVSENLLTVIFSAG